MDKFETEQLEHIKTLADELQSCFIDEDAYSRAPSTLEWRRAGRTVRQITLACHELFGYVKAKRTTELMFTRERLHIVSQETEKTPNVETLDAEEQGFVEFTEKEIQQMPAKFRRLILVQRKRCRMRKRQSGKNTTTYEIQYRRDGYDISACGKTIELAKANMIEKMRNAKPKNRAKDTAIPDTFNAFALYFFKNFRKERVSPKTYQCDINRYNKYLHPAFQERPLRNIIPSDCKKILDAVQAKGMGKTADELYSLMTIIFKGAIAHGIIERNPLNMLLHVQHERESGTALLRSEEDELFSKITEPTFRIAAALALYCGLRPNELSSAKINGSFILAVNSKRKHGKIEYKKIPICKKLQPFLESGIPELPTPQLLRRRIKMALSQHKLYDLRTTFYTRCDELGIAEPARDAFVGHSSGRLTNAYRDLSDAYLLKEGKKLDEW